MDIRDLVRSLLAQDLLSARQYVADAHRSRINWSHVERPLGLSELEICVAAGIVELLAARTDVSPPTWTSAVGPMAQSFVLDPGLERMPRSFALAQTAGPEPLRRRNIVALPDFLEVA